MKDALDLASNNPPQPPEKQPRATKQVKVTARNLEKYQREKYFENLAPMLEAAFPSLIARAASGDMKAVQMIMEMTNYLKPKDGISVITQVYNKNQVAQISSNGNSDAPGGIQSFESILRRLEATDSAKVIDVTTQ